MDFHAEKEEQLLIQFRPLIFKTLQRLNIQKSHMDFDDYFQELQIKLVELARSFECEASEEQVARYQFTAFAGKGLYWHGLNLLRKNNYHSTIPLDDEGLNSLQFVFEENFEDDLHRDEFIASAKERLSNEDFILLVDLMNEQQTMQDLADKFGVVRATIYERKKKIQEKLATLKDYFV